MKGNVLKKFLCTCLVTAAAFAATTISASACTTIYVGGDLVEEGTPFVARTEDYGSDYNKLWFISESGKWKQGDHYVGCPEYGPFEWDFTHDSYRFTYFTNDIYYDGICPECGEKADHYSYTEFGTNEKGVSVSATETLYGNEKVTEADPYRDAEWAEANKSERIGIEETDIPTIILAEASSAREGVKLLLDIYENYGCVAASGVFVCDKDEVWYIENCSGTQYVAIKLNDNMIFLEPNMAVIGRVDLDDENVIASGMSDTLFAPDATCSRSQIVTFLYRMQNSPESKAENPFTDVKADAYYANAVLWAVENGVTTGASATTFDPAGDCTRGQIVTFLYRCLSK